MRQNSILLVIKSPTTLTTDSRSSSVVEQHGTRASLIFKEVPPLAALASPGWRGSRWPALVPHHTALLEVSHLPPPGPGQLRQ